ncbi:hypothetical protein WJX73_009302 [Symbiochloris irregularis]|uniref:DHFR domain-containing protein n=1 Tax=Symbiochloris irregularis TaxID=706552 RepID=A0AAW1PXJ1_9CHLO
MAYFRELTSKTASSSKQNAVIMGRKTWESIPPEYRPLKGRINVVLTRGSAQQQHRENASPNHSGQGEAAKAAARSWPEGVLISESLEAALHLLTEQPYCDKVEHVFVIGGSQVYREALASPACTAVHLTHIEEDYEREASGSTFAEAPAALASRHEEMQYLDMIADIIGKGAKRGDRTGTGTLSKFGVQLRFNLRHSFPLLTSKKTFWRGVAEELLWFISGSTDAGVLKRKNIGIWDGNSSKEYLASIGLGHREEGDLGPVYGFQWRHFGADYTDMHADYTGKGVDQLAQVIKQLRENPDDRRIVLSAWNPEALPLMALPPCHMMCQFYVAEGELSCQMVQRSADMGLGVPFNIASYALLTRLLAHVCNLTPGELVIVLGDAHVYANHVAPLQAQLLNPPFPFPELKINPQKREIDDILFEDLQLEHYHSHSRIPMQMAV